MNSKNLYHHHYPNWLLKQPKLIHLIYGAQWLVHLHKWHLQPSVIGELKRLQPFATVADIGCGEGQFSLGLSQRFPDLQFLLVDRLNDHLDFAARCTSKEKHRFSFQCAEAATFSAERPLELLLCLGVLQYCMDDEQVLRHFLHQIKPGGRLLLYVPVYGREILGFYRKLRDKWPDYEEVQGRKRIYTTEQVLELLSRVGFQTKHTRYAYGYCGILSNEWFNSMLLILVHGNLLQKLGASILFLAFWPLMLMLMALDFVIPKSNGNCLLLVAEKPMG